MRTVVHDQEEELRFMFEVRPKGPASTVVRLMPWNRHTGEICDDVLYVKWHQIK